MESHPGLARVCQGHPGHGLTRRVERFLPGRCTGRSFDKPGPVQPPGRPGPGSTRRAGPGLITMGWCRKTSYITNHSLNHFLITQTHLYYSHQIKKYIFNPNIKYL